MSHKGGHHNHNHNHDDDDDGSGSRTSSSVGEHSRVSTKSGRSAVSFGSASLSGSLVSFGAVVARGGGQMMRMLGMVEEEVDADPPAPEWGLPVDQAGIEAGIKRAQKRTDDVVSTSLEGVSKTVKDAKANLVVQSAESMFIASAVGKTIDKDGNNRESVLVYKATNESRRREMLRLKKAAIKNMNQNHFGLTVIRAEGTCDDNRTFIEHR